MRRAYAKGVPGIQHRALVIAAIRERAAQPGASLEEATREILDQEGEWRRQELAARWSPGDAMAEVIGETALAVGRLIGRAVRRAPADRRGDPRAGDAAGPRDPAV